MRITTTSEKQKRWYCCPLCPQLGSQSTYLSMGDPTSSLMWEELVEQGWWWFITECRLIRACDLAYQLSQPFPAARGLRADGNFHVAYPGSWQLGYREQKWLRPHEGQQKIRTKISQFFCALTTWKRVLFLPILRKCPSTEELQTDLFWNGERTPGRIRE